MPRRMRIEGPTILLAVLIYGAWGLVTWWHAALPTWLLVCAGGWLVAWHGSLQHETIHGHPTGYISPIISPLPSPIPLLTRNRVICPARPVSWDG